MTDVVEVKDIYGSKVGDLCTIPVTAGEVLVFQLPRATEMLSTAYIDQAKLSLRKILPPGIEALIIGADVDIYTICAEDATVLRLKGIL